jgi:hypothetical protein
MMAPSGFGCAGVLLHHIDVAVGSPEVEPSVTFCGPDEVTNQLDIGGCELFASAGDVTHGESYEYGVPDFGWEEGRIRFAAEDLHVIASP